MRPIIGIAGRPFFVTSGGSQIRSYRADHTYTDSVKRAGGLPVVLVPIENEALDDILDHIDGLMLTGGGDVDPARYGEDTHEAVNGVNAERDAFELDLVHKVYSRRMPTMAICRGLQIVNVALGGTLVQDLPSHTGAHGHDVTGEGAYQPHSEALIEPGCRIAEVIGEGLHRINSLHHQAVERLGEGLRVVGTAPDGTIEAIEHEDDSWPLLAVQWHPEFLGVADHGESHDLFEAFVETAAKYRADS
jgi:putative glutamine amidotransferase